MTNHHRSPSSPWPRTARGYYAITGILLGMFMVAATAWGQPPRPGTHPLDHENRLRPDTGDRCPVCAMRPAKYPRFAAAVQLQDDTTFYFCSAGCMLKAWLRPDVFLAAGPDDLKQPVAQDYFSGRPLDARTVFWISGSDVVGPMGTALVPLREKADVDVFRRRHGGTRVFQLSDLNEDNWKALTDKPFRF